MNRAILTPLTVAAVVAGFAQAGQFHFEDRARKLSVDASSGRGDQTTNGYHIIVRGNVLVSATDRATTVRCDELVGDIVNGKSGSQLTHATATGRVRISKSLTNAQGKQTTEIEGTRAVYAAQSVTSTVDMTGPVTLRNSNSAKNQTLVATGNRGRATLEASTKGQAASALQRAELVGNVRVVVNEAQSKGKSHLVATGGRMMLDSTAKPRTILLTENVQIKAEGNAALFSVRNQKRVLLRLNDQDEIVSWTTEAG